MNRLQEDLINAVAQNKYDLVAQIIKERGVDPNFFNAEMGRESPLYVACWNQNAKMVRLLVSLGAKIHKKAISFFAWEELMRCKVSVTPVLRELYDAQQNK